MYRLLLFLPLAYGCASPAHSTYSQAAPSPAFPAPLLTPSGTGAPIVGQPGQGAPEYPRSPHHRELPPTREPGLWAGDAPQASRAGPQEGSQEGAPRPLRDAQKTPIDADLLERLKQAIQECADKAYADILRKYLNGRRPTDQECDQLVTNARGEQVSLARWLGSEMHDEAQRCAEEVLTRLKPGGFFTNPRYRRVPKDPSKKNPDPSKAEDWRTEWIDPREEGLLSWAEKLGTIVPDIVIHVGHPLLIQAVLDFKFPCKSNPKLSWGKYPLGHPYAGRAQNEIYKALLKEDPSPIEPNRDP